MLKFFTGKRIYISGILACALFLLFPNHAVATTAPTPHPPVNNSVLYTYITDCKSPALRATQGFIIPVGLITIDNLYLHLHGSENPEASTLCSLKPGHGLCDAASTLRNNNIRAAIILSMENSGDKQLTQAERNCVLNEAQTKISTVAKIENNNYTITADSGGSTKVIKFLEQGFVAKKTILFNGCLDENCNKIAAFKDSGQLLMYAAPLTLSQSTQAYQNYPNKSFLLKLPEEIQAQSTVSFCYADHILGNKCGGNAQTVTIPLPTKYGIGQACKVDSDCPGGVDLDCEDSDVDTDGDGVDNDFCVCKTPLHCSGAYGEKYPGQQWECKNDKGIDQAHTLHFCKSNEGTVMYPLQSLEKSSGNSDSSLSSELARTYESTPLTESEILALIQKPSPKIRIPGVTFTDLTASGKLSSEEDGTVFLDIPYIGEYISAVYNYLILIAGVVCVVRIIVGGFLYAVPDTSGESKSTALKMIMHAVTGLLLAVSSYTILYLFNPELVQFRNLKVFFARPINMNVIVPWVQPDGTVLANPIFGAAGGGGPAPATGSGPVPIDDNFHHSSAAKAAKLSDQNIKEVAATIGIDQCLLWAFVNKESGGNLHAIGHDDNYTSTLKNVGARRDFLLSGKRYSGSTFTPPANSIADWEAKGGGTKLNNYTNSGNKILNDDKFQVGKPPDYGIDWRFHHGISFMQITIFPVPGNNRLGSKINGPNGPEWARSIYGRWYTVSDLLNPDLSLQAALRFITGGGNKASGCGQLQNAATAFNCLKVSDPAMFRALDFYDKCPLNKGMEVTDADRQKYCSGKYRTKGCTVK